MMWDELERYVRQYCFLSPAHINVLNAILQANNKQHEIGSIVATELEEKEEKYGDNLGIL